MRREVLLLREMIDAAERAVSLVDGVDAAGLERDRLLAEALLWNFTVLGEAASQIDAGFKESFSDVEWSRPARLRNRIVHGYWSVDLTVLHKTAVDDLPRFIDRLRSVLDAIGADAE